MSLRAVFLDVGNTLITEWPSRFEIYAEHACSRGLDADAEQMKACMRRAHDALPTELEGAYRYTDLWFRRFIRHVFHQQLGLAEAELPALTEELFLRFEDPGTFRSFPGLRALLARLRAEGLVLGVISNWSARLDTVLGGLHLTDAFDFVLCSALERAEKPDPVLFQRALARAGVAPAEALHAGDHLVRDVQAARALGLQAVLVDHAGRFGPDEETEGVPRVGGLPELEAVILERCR